MTSFREKSVKTAKIEGNSILEMMLGNGVSIPQLFWPTVRKKCSSDREFFLKFEAEGWEFAKFFEITRTICSSSEKSEQSLVTECLFL